MAISIIQPALTNAAIIAALGYTPASAGAVVMADGSAAAPGMFFGSDVNTGFYQETPGDNTLSISLGGAEYVRFASSNLNFRAPVTIGGTYFTPLVDFEVQPTINAGYGEVRVVGDAAARSDFVALYHHNGLGFIETWKTTGEATIDISPKSKDLTSAEVVQMFRNSESVGARKFRIFDGGSGSATAQTELQGLSDGYINRNGGMLGIATSAPLATLHVVSTRGATTNEVARFSTTATAGAGLSLGYNNTTPSAYIQNLYASGNPDIKIGFGATLGSNVAVTFSSTGLLSAFGGNITVPAGSYAGIGLTAPLATLHVQDDSGATTGEIARFTRSAGGTALGASIGYSDSGSTAAYFYNRYSGATDAALSFGFGTTFGSGIALTLTQNLNAAFGGNITNPAGKFVGFGTASPLATLHVEDDSGATTGEIARFTRSVGGTALGLSLGYADASTTEAYLYNRNAIAASNVKIGFGTTMGSSVALSVIRGTGTVVNYGTVTGTATTAAVPFGVEGADTNIDMALVPKGAGVVQFGTFTATGGETYAGYISVKDSGGTVRKLAVFA